jgi:hypothetical protein
MVSWGCDSDFGMEYADEGAAPSKADDQAGQGEGGDIEVAGVAMGSAISAEKEITRPANTFHPDDTVYVGVTLRGSASDTHLTARWFHGPELELIGKTRFRASPDGLEITEMHIGETPEPLEVGQYRVEVRMNGKIVEVRDFEVVPENVELEGT